MGGDDAAVIVVGGGHAGVEAALAAARLGVPTLLVTGDPERIGTLACNPSIGGSAKGQLVREIDALGGEMARITDRVGAPRALAQRVQGPVGPRAARAGRQARLRARRGETLASAAEPASSPAWSRIWSSRPARARRALRRRPDLRAANVVLATGTFLGGKIFRGDEVRAEGRFGEAPALGLSAALAPPGLSRSAA